jgi:hypothetical protein
MGARMTPLPKCEYGHVYREMVQVQKPRCCIYCGAPEPEHLVSDAMKKPPVLEPQTEKDNTNG